MNLDGMKDPQQQPVAAECEQCQGEIYSGGEAVKHEGNLFCETACLEEHLLENADFEEVAV